MFALLPVIDYLRIKSLRAYIISASLLILSVIARAFLRYRYMFRSAYIFTPLVIIFFIAYFLLVKAGTGKKLFCFFNSVMLCSFCKLYTVFIMADVEAHNKIWDVTGLFTIESGLVYIALALIIGAIFFRTLYIKLPMLITQEYIDSSWDYLFLVPLSLSALILWSVPLHPNLATVGRLRPAALIFLWLFLMTILLLYHVFWWTAEKISQGARLQNENTLLTMEGKRYEELKIYMDETRALRHDFRQHILVITQLAGSGRFNELQNYLLQFTKSTDSGYKNFCSNIAVDAAASHYAALAETQGVKIEWSLNLPHNLPMKESDYCVILGNLLENALSAVKNLSSQERSIHVISSNNIFSVDIILHCSN
ncbi:MAG: GHKL domain-containing protein [Synergistaceae bacterium]|nr:GHKL domain-containing protein [Synergistaceae bacterium]